MREILFKAMRKFDKVWVEGYYWKSNASTHMIDSFEDGRNCPTPNEVDPETVCQFTGLLDKNGKKIFEGDIVRILDADLAGAVKCMVGGTWYIDHANVCMKYIWQIHCNICETDRVRCFLTFFDSYELEIISNIHDKKEGV